MSNNILQDNTVKSKIQIVDTGATAEHALARAKVSLISVKPATFQLVHVWLELCFQGEAMLLLESSAQHLISLIYRCAE